MIASEVIERIAQLLYQQAGYDDYYVKTFPNRAWGNLKDKSKEKWYWKAKAIFNLVESMRN